MTNDLHSFMKEFNKRTKEVQPLLYITRATELQQAAMVHWLHLRLTLNQAMGIRYMHFSVASSMSLAWYSGGA